MKGQKISEEIEEYLEMLYRIKEKGGHAKTLALASALRIKPASVSEMLRKLERLGLVKYEPYYGAVLTKKGEDIGSRITRRHRILESFLEFIGVKKRVHAEACVLEHAISDEVEKRIEKLIKNSGAVALAHLKKDTNAKIVLVGTDRKTAQRLRDMGLTEGTTITLKKSAPFKGALELAVRGTRLVVGRKLAMNIFVNVVR